jgi:hypothetical protein
MSSPDVASLFHTQDQRDIASRTKPSDSMSYLPVADLGPLRKDCDRVSSVELQTSPGLVRPSEQPTEDSRQKTADDRTGEQACVPCACTTYAPRRTWDSLQSIIVLRCMALHGVGENDTCSTITRYKPAPSGCLWILWQVEMRSRQAHPPCVLCYSCYWRSGALYSVRESSEYSVPVL